MGRHIMDAENVRSREQPVEPCRQRARQTLRHRAVGQHPEEGLARDPEQDRLAEFGPEQGNGTNGSEILLQRLAEPDAGIKRDAG